MVERIVEDSRAELGMDPAELRRLNMIRPDQFPYDTPVALTYDTGTTRPASTSALELIDYAGFPGAPQAAAAAGKRRGSACLLHRSLRSGAVDSWRFSSARVWVFMRAARSASIPPANVTVFTGSHSHGQGHETTFAQSGRDRFGIALTMWKWCTAIPAGSSSAWAPTARALWRWAARRLMGAADKLIAKGKKIAAHMLEADAEPSISRTAVLSCRTATRR